MSTIRFETVSTIDGNITTTVHSTVAYETIKDNEGNEIATDISYEKRRKISSITKKIEGFKRYLYVDVNTGTPISMEHEDYGLIGFLWFENESLLCGGKKLIDYDGCYALHKEIIGTIRSLGYTIPIDMI